MTMNDEDILRLLNDVTPHPKRLVAKKSFTYTLDDTLLRSEEMRLRDALKEHGVTALKAGLEVELVLEEMPPPDSMSKDEHGIMHWEHRKQQFIHQQQNAIAKTEDTAERRRLEEELSLMQGFNARETLFHELIHDPEVSAVITPIPLTQLPGQAAIAYYDYRDKLELSTRLLDARDMQGVHDVIVHKIDALMAEYDLQKQCEMCFHYNFSFWNGETNLFDPLRFDEQPIALELARGVARVLHDSPVAFYTAEQMRESPIPGISLGPSRAMHMRMAGSGADARCELRLGVGSGVDEALHDFTFLSVLLMAGAKYGLETAEQDKKQERTPILKRRGAFSYATPDAAYVAHVLNGLTIHEDGTAECYAPYVQSIAHILGRVLDMLPRRYNEYTLPEDKKEALGEKLITFFNGIRIEENNGSQTLAWPPNRNIPKHAQVWLKENITLDALMPALVLDIPYPMLTATRNPSQKPTEYAMRMRESAALARVLSPEFRADLSDTLSSTFDLPFSAANVTDTHTNSKINGPTH